MDSVSWFPSRFEQSKYTQRTETRKTSNTIKFGKKEVSVPVAGAIILGGLAAVGSGVYLAARGKAKFKFSKEEEENIQKLIDDNKISKEFADFFKDLIRRGEFNSPEKFYKKLGKYLGYDKLPALIVKPDMHGGAEYNYVKGTITIEPNTKLSTVFHELIHFSQLEKVYRAFGKEAMAEARVTGVRNEFIFDAKHFDSNKSKKIFGKKFEDVTEEEFEAYLSGIKSKILNKFDESFYKSVAAKKGELTPEEYKKAQAYLDGMKAPDRNSSIIEREAYSRQINLEKMILQFCELFKNKGNAA